LGMALEIVLKSTIEAMDHRSVEPINFHEYRCSGPGVRLSSLVPPCGY
jgi:hypothetical protein